LFVRLGLCREGGSKVILGSGVDLDEIQPLPQPGGTPVVIFPGRVLYEKGAAEFAAAARELQRSGGRARFAIVGAPDPASRSSVPAEVLQSWVSAGILEWWGWREDMLQVFRQSHIVCLPSYGEGVPRVLIEAAAAERAIVATRVPGCQEIVHDGVNGFLAPPREVRPLVDALRALIADSALRDRFGKAGREIVRRQFTLDRVLAETTGVYTDLLASAGDRNLAAFA